MRDSGDAPVKRDAFWPSNGRHFQSPIPSSCATDEALLISRAEVLDTSAPSCGPSFAMSSVKSVTSWLAREMET